MVHSRQPERSITSHAFMAGEHIHKRVLQCMAHVERACNVRRRNYDCENRSGFVLIYLWGKIAILLPAFVVMLLGLFGVVLFRDIHAFRNLCLVSENENVESTPQNAQSSKRVGWLGRSNT